MNDTVQLERPEGSTPRKLAQLFPGLLPAAAEREGLDLRALLTVINRRKGVILGCAALITGLAYVYVNQLTPRYTAQATLMLEAQKMHVVDIQNVLSGLQGDAAVIATQVEILNSPAMGAKVAPKLHLETVPEFNPSLIPPPAFDPMGWLQDKISSLFGGSSNPVQALPPSKEDFDAGIGPALARHVEASNDGLSYIIKIRATSESPEVAAQIANAYVDTYLLDQLEAKFDATRRASAWLSEHLTDLREKVLSAERAVQLFREQNNLAQSNGTTLTAQQLSELNSQLIIAAADRAQKESALREMQNLVKIPGALESTRVISAAPLVEKLREQEAELLRRQAELATRYKPEHPTMINLNAQIQDIQRKIQLEANNAVRSLADDVNVARAREASLRTTMQGLQHSTTQQDKAQVQLHELEREAQANKALYEDFLNRFKQTTAQEDLRQADARMVAAATPGGLSYPNTPLFMTIAIAVSLAFGVGVAFILELLDNGFRTSDQVEQLLGMSTLGMVPLVGRDQSAHELITAQPVAQYSEAIRSVRTALRYSDVDDPPKVVLVTSSLPTEGKTVFATSLARSVARSGARALLIDCDLRRPGIAKLLGVSEQSGLVALFDGESPLDSIIRVDEASGMHFITGKTGTANPQDILGSQHMRSFLEQMRGRYDLIILDSPPTLAVSDAIILSHIVETTMYIIRWEKTPRHVVAGAIKIMRANGGPIAGAVLARVNTRKHAGYGYGDSAYYYSRDSKYYTAS